MSGGGRRLSESTRLRLTYPTPGSTGREASAHLNSESHPTPVLSSHHTQKTLHTVGMAFFDPPPTPPEEIDPPQPEWSGPPDNFLGAPLALSVVLARTSDIVIAITDGSVFPTGVTFRLSLRIRSLSDELRQSMMMGGPFHSHRGQFGGSDDPTQIPPEQLRFGLQFSDGRKATSLAVAPWGEEKRTEPVLIPTGGGGGLLSWDMNFWLWPLPPPGPLEFVVEWPVADIPLTRTEIDGSLIADAASKAEELWPHVPGENRGIGGYSTQTQMSMGSGGTAYGPSIPDSRSEPTRERDPNP